MRCVTLYFNLSFPSLTLLLALLSFDSSLSEEKEVEEDGGRPCRIFLSLRDSALLPRSRFSGLPLDILSRTALSTSDMVAATGMLGVDVAAFITDVAISRAR